jgi:DNA-binding CsgD family transcriptional regulator
MSATALVDRWPLVGRWDELDVVERAVATGAANGVVLFGPAGVGKTRLADEMRRQLERAGRTTRRAVASSATAATPFGAVAHLLPSEIAGSGAPGDDPADVFRRATDAFAAEGAPPVLVVDDLHLLDATSLALLTQLVANGLVFLIATVRTDELMPDGIETLMRSDRVLRIDLGPLVRDDAETLLHLVLSGPVEGTAMVALWDASGGNVLFLRELVLAARASGALAEIGGVWTVTTALPTTGRLRELLAVRLRLVDPGAQPVLEALACCQRMALDHVAELAPHDALDELERSSLITVVVDDRRRFVILGHPLFGELLRGSLGVLRTRQLLSDEAARVERDGARRREDPLFIASWRLEAGDAADPDLLLRAARLARYAHDFPQVERLARAAHREVPSAEAAHLWGEALYERGAFAESEAVLGPADEAAADARDGSQAAIDVANVRAVNLMWGLQRAADALAVRQRARASATSAEADGLLLAGEASVLTFSGRPADAVAFLAAAAVVDEPRARVARAIAEAPALALTGRTSDALELARAAFIEHSAIGNVVAIAHPGSHIVAQVLALGEAGSLAEALELAGVMHEIAVADGIPIPRMWATLNLGRISLFMGRPATARRWFLECAALAGTTGFVAIRRLALSGVGMTAAQLSDTEAAIAASDEVAPIVGDRTFVAPELWLGPAWTAYAQADPARARELLRTGAAEAEHSGHRTSESWLLHDIARLGAPELVAERLGVLAAECDSPLVAARAAHADALARHDGATLAESVEAFATLGAMLYAAEAAVAAGDAFRRAGEARSATAMQERAASLVALCENAQTPALVSAGDVVPLTRREREIATLAAEGLSSKDIAERLFLSARTVDNHLQRVFTKLGVTRRAELAGALARREEDA